MQINKDTKIYGSFSSNPGNNGCLFFNKKFEENNVNAIYKSFYSNNIQKSVEAVKTLGISGFAVSTPFKNEILKYVDELDSNVSLIGAANTITNNKGYLKAYNTDWIGVYNYLQPYHYNFMYILGNGGFSKAIQFALKKLNISFYVINRKEWDKIPELKGVIFNATPAEVITKETLIDGRPFTEQGKQISLLQAEEQYKIYTNECH